GVGGDGGGRREARRADSAQARRLLHRAGEVPLARLRHHSLGETGSRRSRRGPIPHNRNLTMTFNTETISALLDEGIERALDRLRSARADLKRDIEKLENERERRVQRRKERRR